jgi:hypothetical protein
MQSGEQLRRRKQNEFRKPKIDSLLSSFVNQQIVRSVQPQNPSW